jgi:hypothetical protein
MEMNRQPLGQRISSTLAAKQHLVSYATLLAVLDFAVPLLGGWVQRRSPLAALIASAHSPLYLLGSPSVSVALLLASYIAAVAWLRAGYIRSIVGSLHLGPQSTRQWASMAGLLIITYGASAALDVGVGATSQSGWLSLIEIAQLVITFVLLYADYAIVISGLNPMTAIQRSWVTAVRMLLPSLGVMFFFTLIEGFALPGLIDPHLVGSFADMLPLLAVRLIASGAVSFIADVALIIIYIEAIERGLVPYEG